MQQIYLRMRLFERGSFDFVLQGNNLIKRYLSMFCAKEANQQALSHSNSHKARNLKSVGKRTSRDH